MRYHGWYLGATCCLLPFVASTPLPNVVDDAAVLGVDRE